METSTISALYKCETEKARRLCIPDIGNKLIIKQHLDIGGTFYNDMPELWFSCSIYPCLDVKFSLLNIFVCCRSTGKYTIGISNSNKCISENANLSVMCSLTDDLDWFSFDSARQNENFHVKTFCLSKDEELSAKITGLSNSLSIPLVIKRNTFNLITPDKAKKVKISHYNYLTLNDSTTDCVLISKSGGKFPSHKILLSMHSRPLKDMLKDSSELFFDISDDYVELLLEFVYNHMTIEKYNHHMTKLLEIAKKFALVNLMKSMEPMVMKKVNKDNVFEMLTLAKRYKLNKLKEHLFKFICDNPQVMMTKEWEEFNDLSLAKELLISTAFPQLNIENLKDCCKTNTE